MKRFIKSLIDYKDNDYKIKPLCKILPKVSRYIKCFGETKLMSSYWKWWIVEKDKIWEKVSNNIKKGFDSKAVYTEKYLD